MVQNYWYACKGGVLANPKSAHNQISQSEHKAKKWRHCQAGEVHANK